MSVKKVLAATLLAGSLSISVALFGQYWLETSPEWLRAATQGRAQVLPDFSLPDLQGRTINSSHWAGHVLVLNFWASWCTDCLPLLDTLNSLPAHYKDHSLQVATIAIDDPADVAAFAEKRKLSLPVMIGNPAAIELAHRLGSRTLGLPFTAIFDANGRQVFSDFGAVPAELLAQQLAALLPK